MNTTPQTFILTAREDACTGEVGYCLDALEQFEDMPSVAGEGMIIAHDLLEHQNGVESIGTIADELQALGAAWFIRGQFADLQRGRYRSMYSPEENIASDIARQARDYCYNDEDLPVFDYDPTDDPRADVWAYMVEYAERNNDCDEDEKREHGCTLREFFALVPALLAEGYNKASQRYEDNAAHANALFWNIAEALDPYAKNVPHEGHQIELTFNEDDSTSPNVSEYYEEDDEIGCDECGEWFAVGSGEHVNANGYTFCPDCWANEQGAQDDE